MTSARRLLIIGPSWVGDMVMAQSLFKVLKKRHPEVLIDVLAPLSISHLLCKMPEIHAVMDMPVGHGQLHLATRYKIAKEMARRGYEQCILLPNSFKSALIPWFAGIKKRTGFIGEMRYGLLNDRRHLDKQKLPKTVQRFIALAYTNQDDYFSHHPDHQNIPQPQLTTDIEKSLEVLQSLLKQTSQPLSLEEIKQRQIFALCPGAEYGPAKQWPAKYYAEITKRFSQLADEKKPIVLLLGSPKDKSICHEVSQLSHGNGINLAGMTRLDEVIDLLSLCDLVISNDSGLMHVAAAVDVPVIGIYGSSDPSHTPPLSPKAIPMTLDLECSPCFKRNCIQAKRLNDKFENPGYMACLEQLVPDMVWKECQSLISPA